MKAVSCLAACFFCVLACISCHHQAHADGSRIVADNLSRAKEAFLSKYGQQYGYQGRIDKLYRDNIAPRFPPPGPDVPEQHYLDYTASSLFLQSQLDAIYKDQASHVYGNPHCQNPSACASTSAIHDIKEQLLAFWGTTPDEYEVVITRSGTAALQLVAELFPWTPHRSAFLYFKANHNSVLGIRALACASCSRVGAVEEADMEEWLADAAPEHTANEEAAAAHARLGKHGRDLRYVGPCVLDPKTGRRDGRMQTCSEDEASTITAEGPGSRAPRQCAGAISSSAGSQQVDDAAEVTYSLFAYPLIENYAGARYPERWTSAVQGLSTPQHRWLVLVDTAATVPHHALNLTQLNPDFAIVSFYKLFGLPTGAGALLVRKRLMESLKFTIAFKYWGGGSVFLATAGLRWHLVHQPPARFETGTPPFAEFISVRHGLQAIEDLGGMHAIDNHTWAVSEYLHDSLAALQHSNGKPLVAIFGKWGWHKSGTPERRQVQGPTVNFLVLQPDGQVFSYKTVGREASLAGFHLRWGCMCNPGSCYNSTGVTELEVKEAADAAMRRHPHSEAWEEEEWEWLNATRPGPHGRPISMRLPLGSLRASMGWMSRFEDGYALWTWLNSTYIDRWDVPPDSPVQQRLI